MQGEPVNPPRDKFIEVDLLLNKLILTADFKKNGRILWNHKDFNLSLDWCNLIPKCEIGFKSLLANEDRPEMRDVMYISCMFG